MEQRKLSKIILKQQMKKKVTTLIVLVFTLTLSYSQGKIGSAQTTTNSTTTSSTGCVSGDCNNGWGKWQFNNGYYEGFWVNGNRTGYGLYSWNTEGTYVGFFKDNMLEGYGAYENADGKVVSGMYANGMMNGLGEEVDLDYTWNQGF